APAGVFTGQRLAHGSAWKIFKKATNAQGKVFYNVGKNQWIDGQYVSLSPVVSLKPLKGIVTIDYVPGYGVNLWKAPNTSGGYYAGRKLKHGTQWKTFGLENGFYKVGNNQWIQGKYAKFQAK
ncbi:MAG: SLAP domain-containing protein, partial [Bombilactobacillus sp.]